jgi:L-fucose dehydrogenase
MNLGLKDKIIIVSGGASGIGEGICCALSKEAAIPVIAGRNEVNAKQIVNTIKKQGKEAHYIYSELSPSENCEKIILETLQKFGRIDALINNAGENDHIGLEKGSPAGFINSLHQNLSHYYSLAHYAIDALKKSKGSIINISSKVAVTGQGSSSGYAASKGAQLALTREWAVELLPYEIRVNAILPAEVMTPLYTKWLNKFSDPQKKLEEITKNIPLGKRLTKIDEIASMALFLLSEHAAHITGQFLFVDGGYVHLDRSLPEIAG